jgi:hypothetical protein
MPHLEGPSEVFLILELKYSNLSDICKDWVNPRIKNSIVTHPTSVGQGGISAFKGADRRHNRKQFLILKVHKSVKF